MRSALYCRSRTTVNHREPPAHRSARAMAWFDYDGLMMSHFLRSIDSTSPAAYADANAGSVIPVVIPAGGDFYAESLKFWGVTTLAGKLLGFRTGLSSSTAGLGLRRVVALWRRAPFAEDAGHQ